MTTKIFAGQLQSFNHDGLEIARRRKGDRGLAVRPLLLFVVAVVSFKIFLALHLGLSTYGAKMTTLAEGSGVERVAARAMVLDPVSEWVVVSLRTMID